MRYTREHSQIPREEQKEKKEKRQKLPPLVSLPEKWQREYRRILPLAIRRYAAQWGGSDECKYQIHLYVITCWKHELAQEPKAKKEKADPQGLLFEDP